MKTLKNLIAVAFVFAALFAVTGNSFAGHVGGSGHGGYDCETDTFRK